MKSDELMHYGVKGMKWRTHKASNLSNLHGNNTRTTPSIYSKMGGKVERARDSIEDAKQRRVSKSYARFGRSIINRLFGR